MILCWCLVVKVKLSVLHVLRAIVKKLGEDYLPSLNEEVVPMLYELMEGELVLTINCCFDR